MTIDEAIAEARDNAKNQRDIAEECFEELIANARNKAIDDFAKWLENKKYLMKEIQEHDLCYTHYDELKSNYVVAEYLEEQLKAGEDNV